MSHESISQPADHHIERDHALHLLRQMLRIRRFEEKAAELYSATKIRGFLHLYDGEEAVAVGVIQTLTPEDAVVATYREHGHALPAESERLLIHGLLHLLGYDHERSPAEARRMQRRERALARRLLEPRGG